MWFSTVYDKILVLLNSVLTLSVDLLMILNDLCLRFCLCSVDDTAFQM